MLGHQLQRIHATRLTQCSHLPLLFEIWLLHAHQTIQWPLVLWMSGAVNSSPVCNVIWPSSCNLILKQEPVTYIHVSDIYFAQWMTNEWFSKQQRTICNCKCHVSEAPIKASMPPVWKGACYRNTNVRNRQDIIFPVPWNNSNYSKKFCHMHWIWSTWWINLKLGWPQVHSPLPR